MRVTKEGRTSKLELQTQWNKVKTAQKASSDMAINQIINQYYEEWNVNIRSYLIN